jgi:protein-disulfide isomerase
MRLFSSIVVALACAGCAGAGPASEVGGKPVVGKTGNVDSVCQQYTRRLCVELGPSSESCRSVLGVVALLPNTACAAGLDAFDTTLERIAELRKDCEEVAEGICSALGEDGQACKAIRGDLPDIPPGHCGALLHDQERLIAMLRARQASSGPLNDERWAEITADSAPSFGPHDAAVVIVEFSDFQCPYCGEAAQTVQRIKKDYGTRVRLVFRQFPLSFHPHAQVAAQAALAAYDQGKFWEFHDLLFAHQDALEKDALLGYARQLGMDIEAFESAASGTSSASRVAEDLRLGEAVHVQGTPTMFINKQRIENAIDYEGVSQAIEAALAPAP